MAQKFYVDLDLTNHQIKDIADGTAPKDAINLSQLEAAMADVESGVVGDLTAFVQKATKVNLSEGLKGSTDLTGELNINIDTEWLTDQAGLSIVAGDGIYIDVAEGAVDTISVVAKDDDTNAVVVDDTGVYVKDLSGAVEDLETAVEGLENNNGGYATVDYVNTENGKQDTLIDANAAGVASNAAAITGLQADKADKTVNLTTGNGLSGGGDLSADRSFAVALSADVDNAADFGADGGVYVPDLSDRIKDVEDSVTSVTGNLDLYVLETVYTEGQEAQDDRISDNATAIAAEESRAIGVETALQNTKADKTDLNAYVLTETYTTGQAAQDAKIDANETAIGTNASGLAQEILDRTAGDSALTTRINGLEIETTGGVATVNKVGDKWTITVPSIQLAQTYVGSEADSAGIVADLAGRDPAVAGEPGDLYISSAGGAFIFSGTSWVELAAATTGVNSVTAADETVTVVGGQNVTVKVSAALKTQIDESTAKNEEQDLALGNLAAKDDAQDLVIAGLTAKSHDAATSGSDAIGVAGQAISLKIDPSATELSENASGLTIDLAAYAKTASLETVVTNSHVAATAGNGIAINGAGQVVSAVADPAGIATVGVNGILVPATDLSGYYTKTEVDASQLVQDDRLTAVETKNDTQDTAITALQANRTVGVAGDVTVSGGFGTFNHGLGTTDVVVSVKDGQCIVGAAVCVPTADSVQIEATDGVYRVVVTGVV